MIAETLACVLLVLGVSLGWCGLFAGRFGLSGPEALVAGAAVSLLAAWAIAWAAFTSGAPLSLYWAIPSSSALAIVLGRRGFPRLAAGAASLDLAGGQLMVTAWCVGWLSLVRVHSGGAWTGDWFEHWERAHYFLRQWPSNGTLFIDTYLLPARPPLANVLTAAFLWMTRVDYAHYQLVMAVLSSLAFLPVGLLAQRFGGAGSARVAALVVMVNPLFLQNATFPWTKLLAVFFILAGLYFFLRTRDERFRPAPAALCALCLAGAVLTHYSAGPYVVVLAIAWIAVGASGSWGRPFCAATAMAAAIGALVVAPWFAWSLANFGWNGTFLSNSSVTSLDRVHGSHVAKILLNLRDTLVPPQVRGFEGRLFVQSSPWGRLRDQCFLCYQTNLPLALGSLGWLALSREALRSARSASPGDRRLWTFAVAGFVLLSIAVYGDREHYGIVHICMQAVVLLGLAFIAARWSALGRAWRWTLAVGWCIDLALGIALQFSIESQSIDRWLGSARSQDEAALTYSPVAQVNYFQKINAHLQFLGDTLPVNPVLVVALLAALLGLAAARAARPGPVEPAGPSL